jgi:serine/threonine protein kinase
MALSPGTRIGQYEVLAQLGAGGMGEVYRAHDSRLGRDVALKVLHPDVARDEVRLERFTREARAVAALNHPHIVTIYSTENVDGVRFLTMELVEGETLAALVAVDRLPIERFLEIALALSDALSAAHQKQITHRDLKPGNIMVSHDGRVKILDFGLARVGGSGIDIGATREAVTQVGMVVGTIPYMAPEQVEGHATDARSDLFSLGVVFHELLTGQRPFTGSSTAALMSAILRDTPRNVTAERPDVPEALARLIGYCLQKRPEDRIQTARQIHDEIRRLKQENQSGASRPRSSGALIVAPELHSIAVLPFADLSPGKDQDWFCDGIAEEILNALSRLPDLRVAARASTFSLRGKADDLRAIGDKLNVQTVLEGSVRRAGERVRITAQLSDVQQGRQLWSERFDRELKDIFDIQDEIARAIVERLKVTLVKGQNERLVPKVTANIDAYQLLLKGRILLTRRGRAIIDAMSYFEQAVALDPHLGEAHALLADAHRLTALYGLRPPTEAMSRARAAAERALAIDPNQVEALATLANIASTFDWDVEGGTALSDRALEIDPSHVRTLAERAIALVTTESVSQIRRDHILEDVRRARARDPLSAWALSVESMCLACIGRVDDAIARAERAVAMDPENFTAHWTLVLTLAWNGRHDEALTAAGPALAMSGRHPRVLSEVAALHATRGETGAAQAIHDELRERARSEHVGLAEQAAVAASTGKLDEARFLIREALAVRDPYLRFWKFPAWRSVWADAECAALLRNSALFR